MPAADRVLVVGAGVAGLAAATLLCRGGVAVDLVEARADVGAQGSGITLQRNALAVLRTVGVLDEVLAAGYPFDGAGLRSADGTLLADLPGGPPSDLPGTVGCSRPVLAGIMLEAARREGVDVRLGVALTGLADDGDGVDVVLDDGSTARYALVVGADGVHSPVRGLLGVDLPTQPLGMGIWRVVTPRPAAVVRTDLCYDGPCHIAGFCPTGADSLYAYLVEDDGDPARTSPAEQVAHVRALASAYHGPWDDIRAGITDDAPVNHARFEWHLLPGPWHRGRVVLIGDAAHVFPPTVAQGAAMALEDALVLAELLTAPDGAPGGALDDVLDAFTARRSARVETVTRASVQLAEWLRDGVRGDVPGLMGLVAGTVAQPA